VLCCFFDWGVAAMKSRDRTGPLLLGIAVFSASLMCLAPFCSGESSSKELEIKAIPTWDVKHDIGPSGPVTDLHCDVGDVSVSSLPTPAPAASIDSTPRGAIAQHTPPSKRSRQTRGNFFRHRFFYVSGAIVRVRGCLILHCRQRADPPHAAPQIEKANTVQLFGILDELANTTYFRLVSINLDGKCK